MDTSKGIIHSEGTYRGPHGKEIFYQAWTPRESPRGILLIVHGLKEHSGRFVNLVDYFIPAGFAIYGFDLPGHGRSAGTRTYIQKFQEYVDVLQNFSQKVQDRHPLTPVFLYGHSLGTLISLALLLEDQTNYRGAILSGPLFTIPEDTSPLLISLGKILSTLLPKLRVLPIDVEAISRDPNVIKEYREDPLVFQGNTTARLGAEMMKAIQEVQDRAHEIKLPILILQGGLDRIVDPLAAESLYQTVSSADKTLNVYEGYFHELHNEPHHDRVKVFQDIMIWLDRQLTTPR
ncbi:MAG: lysophospholipase [Anaerolineales bacterium]|nr:lysophospholipase [Anaerolineales bacterium]